MACSPYSVHCQSRVQSPGLPLTVLRPDERRAWGWLHSFGRHQTRKQGKQANRASLALPTVAAARRRWRAPGPPARLPAKWSGRRRTNGAL